jgi:hypothetical protein
MPPSIQIHEVNIGLGVSIAFGIIGCFIPRPMIVRSTAIIGGHDISFGILLLAGKPTFLS